MKREVAPSPDQPPADDARRSRLRRLAELTPSERLERLEALNRELFALRDDARRGRR